MKIKNSHFYKKFFIKPWSLIVGAIIIAILNIIIFIINGKPWGVNAPITYWGAWIYKALGAHPENWSYFQGKKGEVLSNSFFNHSGSIMNIGIILGAMLASLLSSRFKIRKINSKKQILSAIVGGLLMGFGATIALGCNISALFSGIASMSLHGWEYLIFAFLGAWVGTKLLINFFA